MLILPFNVGNETYAIDSNHVVEVVPRVNLKKIPHVSDFVGGMMNFGGIPIPVIDMSLLIENHPSTNCLHTRIVILSHSLNDQEIHLGIIGEKITDTFEIEPSKFMDCGIRIKEFPFLDGVFTEDKFTIQLINVEILFQSMRGILFQ